MAATKLSIYQDALRLLADARLDVITDDVESRYALDDAWAESVSFVLRHAAWRFALKTVALSTSMGALPGFDSAYSRPTDWLRTHALFVLADKSERPVDVREQGLLFSANNNTAPVYIRYVSTDFLDPALANNPWPEHFARAAAAYLAFQVAERVTGERSAASRMSTVFSQHLAEAVTRDALPENPWLAAQLDGTFARIAAAMVDAGFWRFAMPAPVLMTTAATPGGGFARSVDTPAAWSRTRALFQLTSDGRRVPFDVRERDAIWYTDVTSFYAEYIDHTLTNDTRNWPEHYMRAVLRQIEFDRANLADAADQQADGLAWKDAFKDTLDSEAEPPDPWLGYQLSGEFDRARRAIISKGFWWWALKEVGYSSQTDQLTTDPAAGLPYRYALPSDWLRTHALFIPWDGNERPINIRESANDWSTDAAAFTARYVSTTALDTTLWPEVVDQAVLAYLEMRALPDAATDPKDRTAAAGTRGAVYQRLLDEALALYSRAPDQWLRFQLDGRFRSAAQMMVETGRWRFAVKTVSLTESSDPLPAEGSDGTVSDSYGYRFILPDDHLKTIWVYFLYGSGLYAYREDVDYREEGGAIHANRTPITIRYISRLGLDVTKWPAHVREAVLAYLEYTEANADPKMAGVATAKLKLYEHAMEGAEKFDDQQDLPPYQSSSRFVSGRYARGAFRDKNAIY